MRRLSALILVVALLGACGTTPTPEPSALPSAALPTPPLAVPSATAPSARPVTSRPSVAPVVTIPTTLTSSRWRGGELFLLAGFRDDIRHDDDADYRTETCRPRRDDLPTGATDGVECALSAGAGERVGAYLFPDDQAARAAYDARLRENGVRVDEDGGCPFGSITPSVPVADQPRAACFVNDAGFANLRIFWPGQSVVIGILGRTGSIRELATWASMLPAGQESSDMADPWLGGIGDASPFEACTDVPTVDRIRGQATLTYEVLYEDGAGIWITDPDGSTPRRIPARGSRGDQYRSSWSPDGRWLAYTVLSSRGGEIYLLDPETGAERHLARTRPMEYGGSDVDTPELSWSPDGRKLAYTEWRVIGGEADPHYLPSAWVVDIASGTKSRVAGGVFLEWSPGSSRLLARLSDGPPVSYPHEMRGPIVIHDLDSGAQTLVGQGAAAAWSSDCRYVLLNGGTRRPGLVVVSGAGARPRLVVDGFDGRWSPVGTDLAVSTNDGKVWRVSVDTGDTLRLGTGTSPAWSDDGSRVAYASTAKGEGLVTVRPDGSGRRVVASDKYPLGHISWSPDGHYIASSHEFIGETCGGPKWGWVIATDGSGVRMLASPWHAHWRPTDASPPEALTADAPPKRSEGCGG